MKILVIHTAFIGDIVLSTPLIQRLKEMYPKSEIDYLTLPANKSVISNNPNLNEIILYDKKGKDKKKPNTGGIGQEPSEKGILIDGVRKTVVKAVVTNDLDERYLLVLQLDTAGKELLQVYFVAEGNKKVNDMTRESDTYWGVYYKKESEFIFSAISAEKNQKCEAGTLLYDIDVESGHYRVEVVNGRIGKNNGDMGDGNAHTFAVKIDGTAEVKK